MSALLWITAAFMQICAVVAYSVIGFGVAFVLLELFVVFSGVLVVLALLAQRRADHNATEITRIIRGRR